MKGNGRIIAFVAVIVLIVVFVLLNMTVFTVSKIRVQNEVYSEYIDNEAIVRASGIDAGDNIFMLSEKKAIEGIEQANPFLMVTAIERRFPSSVIIHINVREGVMSLPIADSDNYAIVDTNLKIVDLVESGSELYLSATHVETISVAMPTAGATLSVDNDYNRALAQIGSVADHEGVKFVSFFDRIYFHDQSVYIVLRMGVTIRIDDYANVPVQDYLRVALEEYKTFDEQSYRRRSGYIYLDTDNIKAWTWSETDTLMSHE